MIFVAVLVLIAASITNANIWSDLALIGMRLNVQDEAKQGVFAPYIGFYPRNSIDPTKKVVFVIHGWLDESSNQAIESIVLALKQADASLQVINVDWSYYSFSNYATSASYLRSIGSVIAYYISTSGISYDKVEMIGHNMGAHIAGFTAKVLYPTILATTVKIRRITALDPAGPIFDSKGASDRLDKQDATMVDALFTDRKCFGSNMPTFYTAVFYANLGLGSQPGCPLYSKAENELNLLRMTKTLIGCSSLRSLDLYLESLTVTYTTQWCQDENAYEKNTCINPPTGTPSSVTWGLGLVLTAKGRYFLKTNMQSPYVPYTGSQ